MKSKITIKALAEKLEDAYSTDRYNGSWTGCVRMLRQRGYNDRAVEAIIRSKHTRWAGDSANKNRGVNSADLARYMDANRALFSVDAMAELIAQTFGDADMQVSILQEGVRS